MREIVLTNQYKKDLKQARKRNLPEDKLNAIAGNGTRIKDFIDIAYLSSRFSYNQMLKFYEEKYKSSIMMPIKAITYFDEINLNEPVRMLDGNKPNWKLISKRLQKMQANPDKVFEKL